MIKLPARYEGLQESSGHHPAFALWTIWTPILHYPKGSTLSDVTLREAGFEPVHTEEAS